MKEFFEQINEKLVEIKNNPGVLFGLIFPYFLVIGLFIGLYFVNNLELISRQTIEPVILDSVLINDIELTESKQIPPIDFNLIKNPTTELLAEGENLYKNNCLSCHGETGAGDGPASVGMNPVPKNLTSKGEWKNGHSIYGIYKTLQEGVPGSSMISYEFLKPQEKFAIIHYIRKNFVPEPDIDSEEDLKSLDALYNLSSGTYIPAQIPVSIAQKIKINEFAEENKIIKNIYEKLNQELKNYQKYFLNTKAALRILLRNQNWRSSPEQLKFLSIKYLENNIFNPIILSINEAELNSLHSKLLKIFNQ